MGQTLAKTLILFLLGFFTLLNVVPFFLAGSRTILLPLSSPGVFLTAELTNGGVR